MAVNNDGFSFMGAIRARILHKGNKILRHWASPVFCKGTQNNAGTAEQTQNTPYH